jgi:hypothetical protein
MYVNLPYPIKAMTAPKNSPTTFRFHHHVKDSLLFISDRDGRSMANMLEWLIKQHCEREGLGWPPKGLESKVESQPKPRARAPRAKGTERK